MKLSSKLIVSGASLLFFGISHAFGETLVDPSAEVGAVEPTDESRGLLRGGGASSSPLFDEIFEANVDQDDRHLQSGTCGGGNRGNGICSNGACCSQYGYCGWTSAHCATSNGGTCGGGSRGNGVCSDGSCCSQYGYCGWSSAYCSGSTSGGGSTTTTSGGTCGGGNRGNGVCSNGACCSQYGYCGYTDAHCAGTSSGGSSGGSTTGGQTAYITYHNYTPGFPLTSTSCSDGANGLITKWGYSTIDPMAPYVSAVSNVVWNSPNCGNCYEVSSGSNKIYVTAIDGCGAGPNGQVHFDLHPTAFNQLLGSAGVAAGSGTATFREVASSMCQGNRG